MFTLSLRRGRWSRYSQPQYYIPHLPNALQRQASQYPPSSTISRQHSFTSGSISNLDGYRFQATLACYSFHLLFFKKECSITDISGFFSRSSRRSINSWLTDALWQWPTKFYPLRHRTNFDFICRFLISVSFDVAFPCTLKKASTRTKLTAACYFSLRHDRLLKKPFIVDFNIRFIWRAAFLL